MRCNPLLDESYVIDPGGSIPLEDASVDLIVSDQTFEHVNDPYAVASEITRVLRPGGWLCARTPSKWGYIGIGARVVPNRLHTALLSRLQPEREAGDVFPTSSLLNARADPKRAFPVNRYDTSYKGGTPSPPTQGPRLWRCVHFRRHRG